MFPGAEHKNDPVNELFFFDYEGLKKVLEHLPDPVVARMTNMCNSRIRGNFFGAISKERGEAIGKLINRESEPDIEKDKIVNQALISVVKKLFKDGFLKREDRFYFGAS